MLRLRRLALAGQVHDDHAHRLAHLDRGQADAGGRVHGLQHVVHQGAQCVVDALHVLGDELQLGVGNGQDIAQRHARSGRSASFGRQGCGVL